MITLTSDFGSPYPAAMRGGILRRCDARLVDVSHELPRGEVRAGAFWLRELLPEFPPAIHLVVIDPGVGTDRAALAVRAGEHVLVGPDNGVLVPAARRLADGDPLESFHISIPETASRTFHGRDVFAPAAAAAHEAGPHSLESVDAFDPGPIAVEYALPEPDVGETQASGVVLAIDDFGNSITNLPGSILADLETIRVDGATVPVAETFGSVEAGTRLATVGSHGNVELDVADGRGDLAFDLESGDSVLLEWS